MRVRVRVRVRVRIRVRIRVGARARRTEEGVELGPPRIIDGGAHAPDEREDEQALQLLATLLGVRRDLRLVVLVVLVAEVAPVVWLGVGLG